VHHSRIYRGSQKPNVIGKICINFTKIKRNENGAWELTPKSPLACSYDFSGPLMGLVSIFPLPKESMTPRQEKTAKAVSPVFMHKMKSGSVAFVIACLPMNSEKMREIAVRLVAMPRVRMAPIIPDATPNCLLSTLPIMAVEFGVIKIRAYALKGYLP
jgi:hypothetical protein